jgi:hypothetical protein
MFLESGKYAIVTGSGRSGTNWLLTMLDASSETHCRNEPHAIANSPFHKIPDSPLDKEYDETISTYWDAFADWTANTFGERDHKIINPKNHIYPWSQITGLAAMPGRPKVQKTLRPIIPALKRGEWPMPFWLGKSEKLSQALAVFKIIGPNFPVWKTEWILQNRQHIPIIHIIRHPGGYLNSSLNRFFSNLSSELQESEKQLRQNRLRMGSSIYPEWADIFGDIESMTLLESIAWFWRFNNEILYQVGKQSSNYLPIVYEDLAQRPVELAKKVYEHCHLRWTTDVEVRIQHGLDQSMWGKLEKKPSSIAFGWGTKLKSEHQELVQKVLDTSGITYFWDS